MNDIRLSPHFKMREFQCRCCGTVKLSAKLLEMLEEMRGRRGAPIIITSGYRCAAHNRKVGGAPRSLHMYGMAADISARAADQMALGAIAKSLGFTEIIYGVKKAYIHVAIR